jgi:ABC-type antimicrobial peptide transport system permease subunit
MRASLTIVGFAAGTAALGAVSLISDSLADLNARQLAASGSLNIKISSLPSYWLDGVAFDYTNPPIAIDSGFARHLAGNLGSLAKVVMVDSTAMRLRIGERLRGVAVVSRIPFSDSLVSAGEAAPAVQVSRRLARELSRAAGHSRLDSIDLPTGRMPVSGVREDAGVRNELAIFTPPALLHALSASSERYLLVVPRSTVIDDEYKNILRIAERAIGASPDLRERWEVSAPGPERMGRASTALLVFRVSFSAIAALCVAVAGIGAANVVLLATFHRAREIGVRRSIGATKTDIKLQFAFESMILAIAGGLCGLALGWAFAKAVSAVMAWRSSVELHVQFSAFSLSAPMAAAVGVGLIAALIPATRASQVDPAVALRDE